MWMHTIPSLRDISSVSSTGCKLGSFWLLRDAKSCLARQSQIFSCDHTSGRKRGTYV